MNNYTEIEIGGEKRGAKLGTLILKKVCERLQITPDELFKKLSGNDLLFTIPELLYESLVLNCKNKGVEFKNSLDDVFDWIDEVGGVGSEYFQSNYFSPLMKSLNVNLGKDSPQKKVATKK